MQFISNAFTSLKEAGGKIISLIKQEYALDHKYYKDVQDKLLDFFAPLKSDLAVLIEFPYVDKVYRDSYYHYFSTKYKTYNRDCIRLCFFSKKVTDSDIFVNPSSDFLQEHFMGYCVLRPTFPDIIGRNLLAKTALKESNFITCIHEENALVCGIKLYIRGFPHSSQDQETITCAETTVWAIMEYFGHKYAEYKPVLPSTILSKLNERSDKRMLPSNGLTHDQISYALKDFGFGTMTYTKEDDKTDFLPNLSVYIESGFPVIAILENNNSDFVHAILMIGRQHVSLPEHLQAFRRRGNRTKKLIPFTSIVKKYIVQDDNLNPYSSIPLNKPGLHYGALHGKTSYRITAFIVPLYKKMYMDVVQARKFFEAIFNDPQYGIRTPQKHIFRMYMASSRSFKQHIAKQKKTDKTLKTYLLSVSLPRFIWCGEYINQADAALGTISSLIVLDATEGGSYWKDSFIFAAHKNESLFYVAVDHTYKLIPLKKNFTGFKMYDLNLK